MFHPTSCILPVKPNSLSQSRNSLPFCAHKSPPLHWTLFWVRWSSPHPQTIFP